MYPVHDVDAILLLALSLSAKRRPAELVEIIAAAELAQGAIPTESKLIESFYRLSAYGLICEMDGGYTLTPDAQQMMAGLRRKADNPERVFGIKECLADYNLNGEHAAISADRGTARCRCSCASCLQKYHRQKSAGAQTQSGRGQPTPRAAQAFPGTATLG